MEFTAYVNYFEGLATKLKAIGHTEAEPKFSRFDIEEVLSGLAAKLDTATPCLLLEAFEGRLSEEADQVADNQEAAFLVVQRAELENFAQQHAIIDLAKKLGLKIIARVRKEARAGTGLKHFDRNSVEYQKVGPVFDNCYGYRFTFSFYNPISLAVDPADWND